jgi:hypothetical protein
MSRKQTRFLLCEQHSAWQSEGRRRLAEMFCEGGPGAGGPCSPQLCQVWPGTDLFSSSVTDDIAADWVRDWAVNTQGCQRGE